MKSKYIRKVVHVGVLVVAGLTLYLLVGSEDVRTISAGEATGIPMACDIFVRIQDIPGESLDRNHKDWIEVQWFDAKISQPVGQATSRIGGRTGGRVEFSELTVGKAIDKATPKLHLYCCNGKHIPDVRIEFCRAAGDKQPYYVIDLKDVMIASVGHTTNAADQTQLELVSFRFGTIEWQYTPTDPTGQPDPGGAVATGWDLVMNKAM
jgi:type VI secretion system secreted protein Hcp